MYQSAEAHPGPSQARCMKSVQIPSFFWSVFSCYWIEYRKIQTRKISVLGHFSRSGSKANLFARIVDLFKLTLLTIFLKNTIMGV